MALFTLFEAALMRDIWAVNFIETARPALSSAGEVIFEPDDKRSKEVLKLVCDCISSVAAFCADRFVLITITNSFRESPREGHFDLRDIHVAGVSFRGGTPLFPVSSSRLLTACLTTLLHRKDSPLLKLSLTKTARRRSSPRRAGSPA
jgi:hypothetical protein